MSKYEEFYQTVTYLGPDVALLTETWVNSEILSSLISFEEYTSYRPDRKVGSRGGVREINVHTSSHRIFRLS